MELFTRIYMESVPAGIHISRFRARNLGSGGLERERSAKQQGVLKNGTVQFGFLGSLYRG